MRLTELEKLNMIKPLMKKYFIVNNEAAIESIEFVSELLELEIEYTKQNEPYATRSLQEMGFAAYYVRELLNVIEEMRKQK